jgi:hypothetical protein
MKTESRHAISPRQRLLAAAVGLAACAALVTARTLDPDPRGYGTHEQLGWPPCGFRKLVGWPCPVCGMTTAWTYAVRGEVRSAVAVNAAGAVACGLSVVVAPWLVASAAAGRWLIAKLTPQALLIAATAFFALTLLDWARRLIT